jgi:hypothetical protein
MMTPAMCWKPLQNPKFLEWVVITLLPSTPTLNSLVSMKSDLAMTIAAGLAIATTLLPTQGSVAQTSRIQGSLNAGFGGVSVTVGAPNPTTFFYPQPGVSTITITDPDGFSYPAFGDGWRNSRQRPATVIVGPIIQPRQVIIAPGSGFPRPGFQGWDSSHCSTVVYGSPIPSPYLANPITGIPCR